MNPRSLAMQTRNGHTEDDLVDVLTWVDTWFNVKGELPLWQGMLLHGLCRFTESINALTLALDADPLGATPSTGAAGYFRWRGYSRLCVGQLQGADRDLRNALATSDVYHVDCLYRGMHHWLTGDDDSAVERFLQGLSLDPGNTLLHVSLAWVYATSQLEDLRSGPTAMRHLPAADEPGGWEQEMLLAVAYAAQDDFSVRHSTWRTCGGCGTAGVPRLVPGTSVAIRSGDPSHLVGDGRTLEVLSAPDSP